MAGIKDNAVYSSENLLSVDEIEKAEFRIDVEKNLRYREEFQDPPCQNIFPLEPVMIQRESERMSPIGISLRIAESKTDSDSIGSSINVENRSLLEDFSRLEDIADSKEAKDSEEDSKISSEDARKSQTRPSMLEEVLSSLNKERNEASESDKGSSEIKNKNKKRKKLKRQEYRGTEGELEWSIGDDPNVSTNDQMLTQDYIELDSAKEKIDEEINEKLENLQSGNLVLKRDPRRVSETSEDQKGFVEDAISEFLNSNEAALSPASIEIGGSSSELVCSSIKAVINSPWAEIHRFENSESLQGYPPADEEKLSPIIDETARQIHLVGEESSAATERMEGPEENQQILLEIPSESTLKGLLFHLVEDDAESATSDKSNLKKKNEKYRWGKKRVDEVEEQIQSLPSDSERTTSGLATKVEVEGTKGQIVSEHLDKESAIINLPPLEGKVNSNPIKEKERLRYPALVKSGDLSSCSHGNKYEAENRIEAANFGGDGLKDDRKDVLVEFEVHESTGSMILIAEIFENSRGIIPDPNYDKKIGFEATTSFATESDMAETQEHERGFNKQKNLQEPSKIDEKVPISNKSNVLLHPIVSGFEDPSRIFESSKGSSSLEVEQLGLMLEKKGLELSKTTSSSEDFNEEDEASTIICVQDKPESIRNDFASSEMGEKTSGRLELLKQTDFRSGKRKRESKNTEVQNQEKLKDALKIRNPQMDENVVYKILADQRSDSILRGKSLDEKESTKYPSFESELPEGQQIHPSDVASYIENLLAVNYEALRECFFSKDAENEHYKSDLNEFHAREKQTDNLNAAYSEALQDDSLERQPEFLECGDALGEGYIATETSPKSSHGANGSDGKEFKKHKNGILAPLEATVTNVTIQPDGTKPADLKSDKLSTKSTKRSDLKMKKIKSVELLPSHDDEAVAKPENASEISKKYDEKEVGKSTKEISESVPGESPTDDSRKDGAESKLRSGQKKRFLSENWCKLEEEATSSQKPWVSQLFPFSSSYVSINSSLKQCLELILFSSFCISL